MASESMHVFITRLNGKSLRYNLNSPASTATVAELFEVYSKYTGIPIKEIIISANARRLISFDNVGNPLKLQDFDIEIGSTLTLIPFLPGGGGMACLKFADVTSEDCFENWRVVTKGSHYREYRNIKKGINFSGTCKNSKCIAYNRTVYMPRGMFEKYGGKCNVNEEIVHLQCPACKNAIQDKDCTGLGIHNCVANIDGKTKKKVEFNYKIQANINEFKAVREMKNKDKIKYKYITIHLSD